jgi:hypothetical protein
LKAYLKIDSKSDFSNVFLSGLRLTAGFEEIEQSGNLLIFKKEEADREGAIKKRDELIGSIITSGNNEELTILIERANLESREITVPIYKENK